MKSYKEFITESRSPTGQSGIYFPLSWKSEDPEKFGINASRMFRKPLSRPGFYCVVLERVKKLLFYLQTDKGVYNFMDTINDESIVFKYYSDKVTGQSIGLEEAYEYCERQLDYYDKIEKFPTESELKETFYIFSDEGIDVSNYTINYGYESGSLSDENNYEMTQYHKPYLNANFICVLRFDIDYDTNEVENMIHEFEMSIESIKNNDYKVKYYLDSRGFLIVLS